MYHRDLPRNFWLFLFCTEIGFYFDGVQLAMGGRGHVTQHMKGFPVQNNNKNQISRKANQIRSGLPTLIALIYVYKLWKMKTIAVKIL